MSGCPAKYTFQLIAAGLIEKPSPKLSSPSTPDIAWPILVVLVLEYVVWPFLTQFIPDVPRCPVCKSFFQWNEINTYDEGRRGRIRPVSFSCPKCLKTIGVPNWRTSFLKISYFVLFTTFLVLIFALPGDLFWGYVGGLAASIGAIRIVDWFIWRRLEPGSPSPFTPFTKA